MIHPIPLDRELTPPLVVPPPGMTPLEIRLTAGLPHAIALDGLLTLSLVMPTGVAVWWRDADPLALVDRGRVGDQDNRADPAAAPPLRLVLRRGGQRLGIAPLVAGQTLWLPRAGTGAVIRFMVLEWELRAGTLKGAGDVGSRIRLAWAHAGRAPNGFELPAVPRVLARRLPDEGL